MANHTRAHGRFLNASMALTGGVDTPLAVAAPFGARQYLMIHNPSATNSLAFTVDGSTPVVNGNGITLLPGGSASYTIVVPQDAVKAIGTAGQTCTVNWM